MRCSSPRCRTARTRASPSSTPTPAPPRCAPPAPPGRGGIPPSRGKPAGREEGPGGRAGAWDEAACPPASWGHEGTRGRTLSLSLSLASSRRSRAAGAPGRVLLSRTGLGRPGCHRRGPLLRPGGKGARRRASRPLSPAPTRRRRRPCRPPRGALPSGQPGADRVGGGGRGLGKP